MKLFKIIITFIILTNLVSCTTLSLNGASSNQQEQVKKEVLKLLEKEYDQPFKILNFDYKYESHTNAAMDCVFLYCKSEDYGTYYFKIQATDNPIIIMDFKIIEGDDKDSIKRYILYRIE